MSRSAITIRFALLFVLLPCGCASAQTPNPGVELIDETDARTKNPDRYFAHEYARINARRNHFGFDTADGNVRPPKIVGLALSGGGIRSNAFQMGVLAGLHATPYQNATLLDRVDYISSVSGGTWANAALWAWPGDLTALFACLDAIAIGNTPDAGCDATAGLLRNTQRARWIPTPFSGQRKEIWQKDIVTNHLPRCDPHLDNAEPTEGCLSDVLQARPYFIINSTHDAPNDKPSKENFPLEITPDRLTTVADRGSKRPDGTSEKGAVGFFLDFNGRDAARWHRRKFFRALLPGGSDGLESGAQLSRTAAHSSAVVQGLGFGFRALFLDFYFQLTQGRELVRNPQLRKRYVVADGGKSDNTGIVPLVDRGADILVASYMGRESREQPFGDLELAATQAKRLFDCTINQDTDITKVSFSRDYGCPSSPNNVLKPILHVHPWPSNISMFLGKLETGSPQEQTLHAFLLEDLRANEARGTQFPQTKTFQFEYDPRLIRAYYLLGKFVAIHDIADFLRETIAAQ